MSCCDIQAAGACSLGDALKVNTGLAYLSLSANKIDDEGVTFQSHIDGSSHRFTPELSMEIQRGLGLLTMVPTERHRVRSRGKWSCAPSIAVMT
mgnify:CR=1 FL=1